MARQTCTSVTQDCTISVEESSSPSLSKQDCPMYDVLRMIARHVCLASGSKMLPRPGAGHIASLFCSSELSSNCGLQQSERFQQKKHRTCFVHVHFTFWISLSLSVSLSPKFGLRPNMTQKVKSFFVWTQQFRWAKSLRPNFGLSDR